MNDTEDVEYDFIITYIPENRVVVKVEDGEVINDDIYIKKIINRKGENNVNK